MILTPLFLRRRSLPLPSVPFPPRSHHCCCPIARVCVCLYSAATFILVKPLEFSLLPHYMSSSPSRPPPSYLRHPSISASLPFVPTPPYFIPTPPPNPYLSISLLYIYIYLSIYFLSLSFSILSLSITICFSLFILNLLVSRPLTHLLPLYY